MKRLALYIIILYNRTLNHWLRGIDLCRLPVVACLLAAISVLLPGCTDTLEPPEEPDPVPREKVERTVIVYMVADNSISNQVENDTTEMVKAKHLIPSGVNVVVYLDDRTHRPAIYELSRKGGLRLWKQYAEELNSTDADVMYDVLHEIKHYFPANHYGLTLWSHGSGWIPEKQSVRRKSFGEDWHRGTSASAKTEMEIPVLRDVLARLPKLDYIFFDACFMQSIEVAYELRHEANYIIGSPAEIPGPGAPYDVILRALCRSDVKGIVDGYVDTYPTDDTYVGVLLSCIDCAQLSGLAEATGQLLKPFYMGGEELSSYNGFLPYCTDYWKYTYCYDMRTTMRRLLTDGDYNAWMEMFDLAVPFHSLSETHRWFSVFCTNPVVSDPECYGGVSMFLPRSTYDFYGWNTDFQRTAWYAAMGWEETGW